jgi:hypothetical protein
VPLNLKMAADSFSGVAKADRHLNLTAAAAGCISIIFTFDLLMSCLLRFKRFDFEKTKSLKKRAYASKLHFD